MYSELPKVPDQSERQRLVLPYLMCFEDEQIDSFSSN